MRIASMHRVGARRKRDALLSSVRVASIFPVGNVRGDRKDRGCRNPAAIGVVSLDISDERCASLLGDLIDTVIVIAVFREVALYLKIDRYAVLVTNRLNLRIFNCR